MLRVHSPGSAQYGFEIAMTIHNGQFRPVLVERPGSV